jgi:3-phosphoshikimate 1-carboxyvinyltransferase
MKIYEDIFKSQNLEYNITSNSITTIGKISPGKYVVPGNISSQFISGLMFILPTLHEDSSIEIIDDFESSNYVDMTVSILKSFSIIIERTNNGFFIKGNQEYKPTEIIAETDFSQLAFFGVLGTINSNIRIDNIDFTSLQPDKRVISIIEEMGGVVTKGRNYAIFSKTQTSGITIDVSQSPDIAPILTVLAAKSLGITKIINAKRLVIKESNRLLSSFETLKKLGVNVEMGEDNLTIYHTKKFNGGVFDSYNDHRIAMTIAIAATIADSKTTILNAEAVNKSYPDFYKDLEALGVKIKYY